MASIVAFCADGSKIWQRRRDLTWLFWTKLCEKVSSERSFGHAEKEVQREQIIVLLRQIEVLMSQGKGALPGSRDFAAELLSLAEGIRWS